MNLARFVEALIWDARVRLHTRIDDRAAAQLAQRTPSYRRRLGQIYRRRAK